MAVSPPCLRRPFCRRAPGPTCCSSTSPAARSHLQRPRFHVSSHAHVPGARLGRTFLVHTAHLTTPSVARLTFFLKRSLFSHLHEREHRVLLGRNREQTPPPAGTHPAEEGGASLCSVCPWPVPLPRGAVGEMKHGAGQPCVSSHHSFEKKTVSLPQVDNHSRALTRQDNWQVKCHRNGYTQPPPPPTPSGRGLRTWQLARVGVVLTPCRHLLTLSP